MKIVTKFKHKTKLLNAFETSGLYYETKRNGVTLKNFPSILDIDVKENRSKYVFRLPFGYDAKEVKKKEFIFKQLFGEGMELKEDNNIVSISVFHQVQNDKVTFDYEELLKYLKKCKLPIVAGMDKLGKMYVHDMVSHPHMLIAGETGGGKSTSLRSILTSLILYKEHIKNGLELHLVDLKRSEFHLFRHVENTVVMNDKDNLLKCLNYIRKELKKRGDILDSVELTHIDDYNKIKGANVKPYIILCIDEVHMLMNDEMCMEILHEISAIGRALGVFLILATQRPDANKLDTATKSNLTVTYAFAHRDKLNSDITLGRGSKVDASKIEKAGEFIYQINGKTEVLQSPLLELEKAKELLEPFKVAKPMEDYSNIVEMEEKEEMETVQIGLLEGGGDE